MRTTLLLWLVLSSAAISEWAAAAESPQIPRVIPPAGIEVPKEDLALILAALDELDAGLQKGQSSPLYKLLPDIEIYAKAVRYAVDHGEFYAAKDIDRALEILEIGRQRTKRLAERQAPWTEETGLVVRGYRSKIDGSAQPYGLVIPEQLDLTQPVPLYVWLHGRGDKMTDLQFIHQRGTSVGQISPDNAIVLHPFGRYCNAFKFAGETDVLEAIEAVADQYKIDRKRIVLWGFSMGGAGAWHLGAHYPDRWVAVSPGAGFAETARYQKLDPATVPEYERVLWGWYDAPNYVRNLFNLPVIAYSGELDKQIQAAQVMEEAYQAEGRELPHLIGPGMGHQYHPETLKELAAKIAAEVTKGQDPYPRSLSLQTRTLRYGRAHWLSIEGLHEHWKDSRVDAEVVDHTGVRLKTKNVSRLTIAPPWRPGSGFEERRTLEIDGQKIELTAFNRPMGLQWGTWRKGAEPSWRAIPPAFGTLERLAKTPGLQGPIDDVFLEPFLVVAPSGKSKHEQIDAWVAAELAHFQDRWRRLFRGDVRIKKDYEVTDRDLRDYHLILWGDRSSNRLIEKVVDSLPIGWSESAITVGDLSFPAAGHVLAAIYLNPEQPRKYVVLNSGMTFREAHDKTNSQQTPKLPDWAVIDLSQPPNDRTPGKIAAAGFFDEQWQLKKPIWPEKPTP